MHQNETIFTPVLRYIISKLEDNFEADSKACVAEVKDFISGIKKCNNMLCLEENVDDSGYILDITVELLELICEKNESSIQFWQQKVSEIERQECGKCQICKQCKLYYWHELGQIVLCIDNQYKKDKEYIPLRVVPERINKHLETSVKLKDIYKKNSLFGEPDFDDYLLILKGMSSSTPSILNGIFDTDEFDGGGLYINYHGIGIAIDPGYHFVRNLHHYGLDVLDIDLVIITHEHIDHNNDMRLIDDINKSVSASHKIVWLMDKVSYDVAMIYQENKTGFDKNSNYLIKVEPGKDFVPSYFDEDNKLVDIDKHIHFAFFNTEHILSDDEMPKQHTFGCRLTFVQDDRGLVYTSDTRYFSRIANEIRSADIVIANISGIYEDDYMLVKRKEKHLGYFGCFNMLKETYSEYGHMPELFMISEFWNGQNDIRFDVAKQMQDNIEKIGISGTHIVPAEKGMYVKLSNSYLKCSQCGRFCKKYIIKRPSTLLDNVKVICTECYYD